MTAAGSLGNDDRRQLRHHAQERIIQLSERLEATATDLAACAGRQENRLGPDQVSLGQRALDGVILSAQRVRDRLRSGDSPPSAEQVR